MPTRDLSSPLDDDALLYPGIRSKAHPDGKTYLVPAPDGVDGLLYLRLWELGANLAKGIQLDEDDKRRLQLDGEDEGAFLRKVLSKDTFDEMLADGVPWPKITEIVQDAFLCWAADESMADAVKAMRGAGKALSPNRAARRASAKKQPGAKSTARKTAGPKSSRASSDTPARTTGQGSTRSSKSTPTAQPRKAAQAS